MTTGLGRMPPAPDATARRRAFAIAETATDASRGLPDQVFRPGWGDFLIFDADYLFPDFVGEAKAILDLEGSSCICLTDLKDPDDVRERSSIYIDRSTTPEAYSAAQRADDWRSPVSTLGLASDLGRWAAYCEQQEEFVVIAFRERRWRDALQPALVLLGAVPVLEAIEHPTFWTFEHILPQFRDALIRNYGSKPT